MKKPFKGHNGRSSQIVATKCALSYPKIYGWSKTEKSSIFFHEEETCVVLTPGSFDKELKWKAADAETDIFASFC